MDSPSTPPLRSAIVDGRYTIRERLGSGSLGTVYLAHDGERGCPVALKIIRTEQLISASRRPMQDEFRAIVSLSHPQIARAYDFGFTEAGVPYYTREYVRGSPLPPGPPTREPPSRFLRPLLDLLDALTYLHAQRTLHLDIHAGNLIVADEEDRGSVLIDIGLVRSGQRPLFSLGGDAWPAFPPEMLEGKPVDVTSDLYLVGRLLHYRLTGRTQGRPGLPREIPGWGVRTTLELERVLTKALQPASGGRFRSAAEFRSALTSIIGTEGRSPCLAEPRELIVGRSVELGRLEAALDSAGRGEATLAWVVGGGGTGKTRLLSEARLCAQLRGLPTVEVAFLPDPGPDPLLVRTLRRSRSQSAGRSSWLEPLDPGCGGTPGERAQRAAEAFFRDAGRPLVLLLDDLELADRQSRTLAEALASEILRRRREGVQGRGLALVLATSTPPPAGLAPRGELRPAVLTLRRLSRPASRELFLAATTPLTPPAPMVREAIRTARGVPRSLRQLAARVRRQWRDRGVIPGTARLPEPASSPGDPGPPDLTRLPGEERRIASVLAVIRRAANRSELAAALRATWGGEAEIAGGLRHLVRLDILVARGRGRARRYQLSRLDRTSAVLRPVSRREVDSIHEALIRHLEDAPLPSAGRERVRCLENLARHRLGRGGAPARREAVLRAAEALRESGSHDRAILLLEDASRRERSARQRLRLAEVVGSIVEESGDHEKGIAVFEPLHREEHASLSSFERVRVRRHLGYHYHRAGFADRAREVFGEARSLAVRPRDDETLVFIDAELAELHIFQGDYEEAEAACRRGLARIEEGGGDASFLARMKVLLRASLGHIHMRRLQLPAAREELRAALELSRRHGRLSDRAAILHNLGVTESQLNAFLDARRHFAEAEGLMLRSGNHRDGIKISTNLALLDAKLGRRDDADLQLENALAMLRQYPGQRLECFVAYSRGVVAHHFGDAGTATPSLERAAELSGELGDASMRQFCLAHLAETQLLTGRYARARELLASLAESLAAGGPPVLRRLLWCRTYLLETLLGRRSRAATALERVQATPRTEVLYLETWNDLAVAVGHWLAGEDPTELVEGVSSVFEGLHVPVGQRFARRLRLVASLVRGDGASVQRELDDVEASDPSPNLFLRVAEALAAAEACFSTGDLEASERWLSSASSAIVGSPFLELDVRIEHLRTRIALRKSDLREARRHLHRCLHSRDLLVHYVPEGVRREFLEQPRFASLRRTSQRLSTSPALEVSTRRLRRSYEYEGMVGHSRPMLDLFETLERIRDQELTVLITGETGTGKELVARAVHRRSPRRDQTFLTLSCACLSPELLESELFGHAAGAFTGAESRQEGILESVAGGTLLLDEISLLPLPSQAKLLRVLDAGAVRPLGSAQEIPLDVRFLATTHADLRRAVAEGTFREDLLYRLAGVEVRVPSLRERREDIAYLVKHLLERHASRLDRGVPTVEEEAVAFLEGRRWPGNVRELEMLLLRVLIRSDDPVRIESRLLETIAGEGEGESGGERERGGGSPGVDLTGQDLGELRRDLERRYLTQLFFKLDGDMTRMMRQLGVKSSKLYSWLRDLGVDIRALRRELRRR